MTAFYSTKNYIFFSKYSEKMVFSKRSTGIWYLYYQERLLFPENMVLFLRRKMKDNHSEKNTWKYDIFCKCFRKMVFPKNIELEYNIPCIINKDDIFYPENMILVFRRKMKAYSPPKKIHRNMIFSI